MKIHVKPRPPGAWAEWTMAGRCNLPDSRCRDSHPIGTPHYHPVQRIHYICGDPEPVRLDADS